MDKLDELFQMQRNMSAKFIEVEKFLAQQKEHPEVQAWTMRYLWCLVEEVVEMARCYPMRKFWVKKNEGKEQDKDEALKEYADIWLFLIAVGLINGWDAEKVYKALVDKDSFNQTRFTPTV